MYRIIRADSDQDRGNNTGEVVERVVAQLEERVSAAEADGWTVAGGLQLVSRSRPHGTHHFAMQAMVKTMDAPAVAAVDWQEGIAPSPKITYDPSTGVTNKDFSEKDSAVEYLERNRRREHAEKNRKVAAAAKSAIQGNA